VDDCVDWSGGPTLSVRGHIYSPALAVSTKVNRYAQDKKYILYITLDVDPEWVCRIPFVFFFHSFGHHISEHMGAISYRGVIFRLFSYPHSIFGVWCRWGLGALSLYLFIFLFRILEHIFRLAFMFAFTRWRLA
jgi:hypothetical protein